MREPCREAEVDQLDSCARLVEQDVLKLNIAMSDVALVQVVDCEHNLLPDVLGLDLSHLPVRLSLEVAMQGPTVDVLHDKEHLLVRLKRFIQLGEALVIDLLHDLDLALHALAPVWLEQLELLVDFDCNLLVEDLVQADAYHSICTLAYALANNIVVNIFDGALFCAELVLLVLLRAVSLAFLILLNMVREGMRLRHVNGLVLILLLC